MSMSTTEVVRLAGISYRKLDHWTRRGYVHPAGDPFPGSGNYRRYDDDEARIICALAKLAPMISPHFSYGSVIEALRSGATVFDLIPGVTVDLGRLLGTTKVWQS